MVLEGFKEAASYYPEPGNGREYIGSFGWESQDSNFIL